MYFNIYCPINDLGYGVFSRGLLSGLRSLKFDNFHLSLIGQLDAAVPESPLLEAQIRKNLWRRSATSVALWHEFDLTKFSGNRLVSFPFFETTKLSELGKYYLNQMDSVFVTSNWAKGVVETNVGKSVNCRVLRGGFTPVAVMDMSSLPNDRAFVFLTVGKYETRKSILEVISAYCKAFGDSTKDTRLICHCYNPVFKDFTRTIAADLNKLGITLSPTTSESSLIATHKNAIIEIPKGYVSSEDLQMLYNYCHVGVFPFKGEGWCLPLLEAISAGKPCLATNYSAPTEFLSKEYGYNQDLLLNNYKLQPAQDGLFFKGDRGVWAVPNQDELIDKMRYVYDNYSNILNRSDNSKILENFTWQNCANDFLSNLEELET